MRLPALLLVAAVLVLASAHPAAAGPARELCHYDGARGEVPAGLVLDACVEDEAVSLRDALDVPVVVRAAGTGAAPVRLEVSEGAVGSILRTAGDEGGIVLMPGDVVRWPLTGGPAEWTVGALGDPVLVGVATTLAPALAGWSAAPADGSGERVFADVARSIAASASDRAACAKGTNFLGTAACDVDASAAIARAVVDRLPAAVADDLLLVVLDPDTWTGWTGARADLPSVGERRLTQSARPAPPAPAPRRPAPTGPAPAAPSRSAAPQAPVDPAQAAVEAWLQRLRDRAAALAADGNRTWDGHGNGNGKGHGKGHGKKDD
jgi:hypothetical protein